MRIEEVLANRTTTVVPVIEGVYDLGNVSAVIRSSEALGYQSVHVVESSEEFKSSPRTTQGSDKWLDITRWDKSRDCVAHLKKLGYRVVVTHLEASMPLDDIDFTTPAALVFGNEANGVSDEMLAAADGRCIIPMLGFVESFNVSVAAAVALYHAYRQRLSRLGSHGDLDSGTRAFLRARFYMKSVKEPEAILTRLG
jgi:tRNA (guanosine-2'-O-)-methyltransferase